MRFHYDLTQAEPVIRDCPVYDGTALLNGELLMLGTTGVATGADQGISLVNAYATDTTQAVNAAGILNDSRYVGTAAGGTAPTAVFSTNTATGAYYGKVIINPTAVYLAEYRQGDAVAITSTSGTALTITGLTIADAGKWVYFVNSAGTTGAKYSLRMLKSTVASVGTMDSALTVNGTTADTIIKIHQPNCALTQLSSDGTMISTTAGTAAGTKLRIMENYIKDVGTATQPLRTKTFNGMNNLNGAQFFSDICLLNALYP